MKTKKNLTLDDKYIAKYIARYSTILNLGVLCITGIIYYFLFLWIKSILPWLMVQFSPNDPWLFLICILFGNGLLVIFIWSILMHIWTRLFNEQWRELLKYKETLNNLFIVAGNKQKDIGKILGLTELVYLISKNLVRISSLQKRESIKDVKIVSFVQSNLAEVSPILINIRNNLFQAISEQRSALESAKTEVEKHITGTPELLAVSEAQKVRLDRQIEQFEELQRVLVQV